MSSHNLSHYSQYVRNKYWKQGKHKIEFIFNEEHWWCQNLLCNFKPCKIILYKFFLKKKPSWHIPTYHFLSKCCVVLDKFLPNMDKMDKDGCGSGGLRNFPHLFILKIWFFQFINGINFRWYYVLFCIVDIMVWIFIFNKLRIYGAQPYPFYIIFQTRISSWYWDVTFSRILIIIWDNWWRWISGTNFLW